MKINSVEFENFYSYKKGKINFNKYKGLVGVEGLNKDTGGSNGAGKSVILEAKLLYTDYLAKAFARVQRMLWSILP